MLIEMITIHDYHIKSRGRIFCVAAQLAGSSRSYFTITEIFSQRKYKQEFGDLQSAFECVRLIVEDVIDGINTFYYGSDSNGNPKIGA